MKSADNQQKNPGSFIHDLVFTLIANFSIAVVVTVITTYRSNNLQDYVPSFISSLVISNCIGLLVMLTLTFLWRYIDARPFLIKQALRVGCLVFCTVVGFLAGTAILSAVGLLDPKYFWVAFRYGIRFALVITLVIGIGAVAYENLREKLREKELMEERARKLAVEARLSSLESRIHPHFLFNTLNSISSLIQEDPRQAERLVERLAALLRFSLESNQSSTVPLSQEMKIVTDYLEIEKARFGDRLRYSINVPPELTAVAVPPLAVQTIVENSIKHAVSKRREGGEVSIRARASQSQVIIEVSDDGPGFKPEEITVGHGLDNLQARLAALFDKRAGLSVSNGEGRATVTIRVPQAQHQSIATV